MSTIKQVIYNALVKSSSPVSGTIPQEFESPEAARDAFIALVMAELFPNESNAPAVPAKKSPKKVETPVKSPKKSPESKAAEKLAAKEAKAAEALAAKEAKAAELLAAKAAKEAEKLAAKEAKAAEVLAAKMALMSLQVPASPKKAKKAKVLENANLQKIDPTWRKALKQASKENAKELEPALLTYVNEMSNVAFNSKGVVDHVNDYLATIQPAPVVEAADYAELEVVEFNGKEYYVNPETKRVYEGEMDTEGSLKVTKPVGYVGMADFKDMNLD